MVASISDNGGRSCINASAIVVPKYAAEIADALAQKLGPIQPTRNDDANARLSGFVLSNPTSKLFALGQKGLTVTAADNSSNPQTMITDTRGGALQELAPGHYVVRLKLSEPLSISVPVQIFVGNETKVKLTINGTAYPVVYSEESGVVPTLGKIRSDMFVELQSSTSVASVNDLVLLKVRGAAPGVGYLANATVLAQQPPTQGTEWLELGASTAINPVNATSISLTTWTYSSVVTMQAIGPAGVSADD